MTRRPPSPPLESRVASAAFAHMEHPLGKHRGGKSHRRWRTAPRGRNKTVIVQYTMLERAVKGHKKWHAILCQLSAALAPCRRNPYLPGNP